MSAARLQASAALWLHQQWQKRGWWARLLWPVSCLAGAYVFAKRRWYQGDAKRVYRAPVPVVIVGNLYVGGVGKTPVVIALVQQLLASGWHPGVISRGYGIELGPAPRVGQGALDASAMGDEPALISELTGAPVSVHPNRRLACQALLKAYPDVDVIVSDDGLQHLALARDLEIVVQDDRQLGNGWLLPAGPLREPSSRMATVDLVITRQALRKQRDAAPSSKNRPTVALQAPSHPAELTMQLEITGLHSLDNTLNISVHEFIKLQENQSTTAIAAISEPDRFFKSLEQTGILIQSTVGLPDHHRLDAAFFKSQSADLLLITAKDAVKCRTLRDPRIWVVSTEAVFSDPRWGAQIAAQILRPL